MLGVADQLPPHAAEDSFSLLPLLKDASWSEAVRPYTIHHSIDGSFAIRQTKWKLSLCAGSGGWSDPKPDVAAADPTLPPVQLYDLEADPGERKNLITEHPDVADGLVKLLAKAIREGRSTKGEAQKNDGTPETFSQAVLKAYPSLKL
jgi:arylsulfatase A-like enzyme